jgi:hypothetical protein
MSVYLDHNQSPEGYTTYARISRTRSAEVQRPFASYVTELLICRSGLFFVSRLVYSFHGGLISGFQSRLL